MKKNNGQDKNEIETVERKVHENEAGVSRSNFLRTLGMGTAALMLPSCGSTRRVGGRGGGDSKGQTYYVDAAGGDDANKGLTPDAPWQTLRKINTITFAPGDMILLKAGSAWSGQLHPKGSGRQGHSIRIGRYGPSSAPPPLVNGDGVKAAVYLRNQEYWEIRDLEITNMADSPGNRAGVRVVGDHQKRKLRHIHLVNLYIHDVTGYLYRDASFNPRYTGGISVRARGEQTGWDGLLIEGCSIKSVDRVAMHVAAPFDQDSPTEANASNVRIQNNTFSDTGGDGAIFNGLTKGCVVQHNVGHDLGMRIEGRGNPIAGLWTWGAKRGTKIQYNEVYGTRVPPNSGDGMAFDHDGYSYGVIWQYNYSHDNEGGFMLMIGNTAQIRYNISQNDGTMATSPIKRDAGGVLVFTVWEPAHNHIYNNTFYVKESHETPIVNTKNRKKEPSYMTNNIIYNLGSGGYSTFASGEKANVIYDYNLYYGNHPPSEPADPHKITADPQLVDPGSGGIGRESVGGYMLEAGSPAIGSGKIIENNGGRDYFGIAVPADAFPNRGASENRP